MRLRYLAAFVGAALSLHAGSDFPEPLESHFSYQPLDGLNVEEGTCRRDPSDVIKVGSEYYVWYTRVSRAPDVFMYPSGYSGTIWYATSEDGIHWRERGRALAKGQAGSFDDFGVFTPNILTAHGKYYLFYTAVRAPMLSEVPTAIGVASAASPDGPWIRNPDNPVLTPAKDAAEFDSFRVDDACLITRGGKYWLYFKGRQQGRSPRETKCGVAIASRPMGPYRKSAVNPVIGSGHEVLVWPQGTGVAALVGSVGPEKNTIQYAPDGLHFRIVSHLIDPPMAPGGYRPDAFTGVSPAIGMRWGIAMKNGANPYLVHYECNFEAR